MCIGSDNKPLKVAIEQSNLYSNSRAQFSTPLWGSGGRGFKSRRSDHLSSSLMRFIQLI